MNASLRKIRGKPVQHREIDLDRLTELGFLTPERKAKAADHVIGGKGRGETPTLKMQDSPIDRMFNRQALSGTEYAALQKYKHHWHHAGLESQLGSADLNRVFSSDPGSMSGMAKTERQAHHRKQYREARAILGHRPGIVVDNVVCAETGLEVAGYAIGWTNKPQAIAAATEYLRDAGYRLAKLWGIG
jgi:hypothetical protein